MTNARGVAGFLQVHAEVDEVHQNLHVPLRLHVAAHHAEAQPRLAVFRHEGRDDGVEGALAGLVDIKMAFFQSEQGAAVL